MMKPDGAVSALMGGVDYQSSVFNRATQAHRQPGSAFKPFVYLAALEAGISPWDERDDEAGRYQWLSSRTNFGGRYYGTLTLADALAHSVNTITVNLAQEVGVKKVVAAAQRAGITSPLEANASLALGTSEVTPLELTARLCRLRQWRLSRHPLFRHRSGRCRRQSPLSPRARRSRSASSRRPVDRDLVAMLWNVITAGTGTGASLSAARGRGQDRHHPEFPGRLVRRFHHRLCRRRSGSAMTIIRPPAASPAAPCRRRSGRARC